MKNTIYFLLATAIFACNTKQENFRNSSIETDNLSAHTTQTVEKMTEAFKKADKFGCLQVKPQTYKVDPTSDTTLLIGTQGSQLHIPSYAFEDMDDCMITDKVTIEVKDYRNSADMALSKIPMTYTNTDGVEYNFSSAGMVDIQGYYKGEPIKFAKNKTLNLDYALTQKGTGINFYKLNNTTQQWTETQKIKTFPVFKKADKKDIPEFLFTVTNPRNMNYDIWLEGEQAKTSLANYMNENYEIPTALKKHLNDSIKNKYKSFTVLFTLDSATGKFVNVRGDSRNPNKRFDKELVNYVASLPPCTFQKVKNPSLSPFKDVYQLSVHRSKWTEREVLEVDKKTIPNRTLVKAHGSEIDPDSEEKIIAGHSYPDIVRELKITGFGVYNCDQIYKMKNRVEITATYVDEKGEEIIGANQLSLIDLEYNASFSFHPSQFSCNAKANNVLLMFTKYGEMYILDKGEFQKKHISETGNYKFKMRRVTNELTSSEKLAAYLGLVAT